MDCMGFHSSCILTTSTHEIALALGTISILLLAAQLIQYNNMSLKMGLALLRMPHFRWERPSLWRKMPSV